MAVNIHPHKGYLNTKFRMYVNGTESVSYHIMCSDGSVMRDRGIVEPNKPHTFQIPVAGVAIVECSDGTNITLTIEDGYRFGGSKLKKAFVFDDCPWLFVVMHDRTYFYNRETKEAYVECISPDEISEVSSDYVIFANKGQEERTLYSLKDQKPILNMANILNYNGESILWKEEDEDNDVLVLYSIGNEKEVLRQNVSLYSLDKDLQRLIFSQGNEVVGMIDLTGDLERTIKNVSYRGEIVWVGGSNLVAIYEEKSYGNTLYIYSIQDDKLVKSLKIDGHLAKIGEKERIDVWARRNAIQDFDLQGSQFPDAVIMADYIEVTLYPCEWDVYYSMNRISLKKSTPYRVDRTEECRLFSCSGQVDQKINAHFTHLVKSGDSICGYNWRESFVSNIRYPGVRYNEGGSVYEYAKDLYLYSDSTLYKLSRNGYWDNGREINCGFEHFEEFGVIKDKDAQICQTLGGYKFGKLISISRFHTPRLQTDEYYVFSRAKSLKGKDIKIPQFLSPNLKYGVSLDAGKVYLCQLDDNKYLQSLILENLFDSSKYHDVLLSEDGKHILYRDEKKAIVMDVNGSVIQEYDNLSYGQQINGLRPLFDMPASLQPKLINPVTGQSLDCEEMSSYQYVSPNGELYADTRLDEYIEYYYRETNQLLSSEAYTRLLKKFRYPWDQKKGSLDWERVKENRKEFVLEHFEYLNNNYPGFINNDRTGKKWDTSVLDEDNRYGYFKALEFVIGKRGIAYIRKVANDSVVAKINLGEPLTFINYVSFSYDSRYVALAGYRGDRQSSWGGLFLVYDLEQNRICGSENTTRAIWMAVFSKSNALASYSSNPFTFFANNETEYDLKDFESKLIERRSFLTFSPDGKLFALSSQGYVSKYDRDGNINAGWGHQPSSLVEIRLESNPYSSIAEYHDLSEYGIAGVASKAGSVASVSFSNDNKKLMMVGNDGVVIIRNLRFEA